MPSSNNQRPHRRLQAWLTGIDLVKMVYRLTQDFPKEEMYGLTSQMRRASISVCSNIAEGAARDTAREFARFLSMAKGSLSELDTQIYIAIELGYLNNADDLIEKQDEVSRLIAGLHRKVMQQTTTTTKS